MNLMFLQNCISPRQMPCIRELPVYESVDRVVVVAPYADYDNCKQTGWKTPELLKVEGIEFLITPTIGVMQKLYEECKGIETFCFFSEINAFPEIVLWTKFSFNYPFKRGVVTEPLLLYDHPLWQYRLRSALKDWRYTKYFDYLLAIGDEFVLYYRFWSKKWRVLPFIYCTEWKERTHPIPTSERLEILYVGSLSDKKNVTEMFQVLCQRVELELGIVGGGEKRAQIEKMNIQPKTEVTLYSIQPMERASEITQQYDVLILPSKHDRWGVIMSEALTVRLYMITNNRCEASYLLKNKQRGMIFTLKEAQGLGNMVDACIVKKGRIGETVNEHIIWSRNYVSDKAVTNYVMQNLWINTYESNALCS